MNPKSTDCEADALTTTPPRRYHESNHKNFSNSDPPKSKVRSKLVFSIESDAMTEASFVMSWNIAHAKHPYSDCEFVAKNMADVVAKLEPNNKELQRLIEKNTMFTPNYTKVHIPNQC